VGTGMKVFFYDSYLPWKRGTNENTNGLLRQSFPKGSSFADVTDEMLQAVVDLINNRPSKRLGLRSPAELLLKCRQKAILVNDLQCHSSVLCQSFTMDFLCIYRI